MKVEEVAGKRTELQAWYAGSLYPKLARAARTGAVAPAAADALDRLLRDFLDLPHEHEREREQAA